MKLVQRMPVFIGYFLFAITLLRGQSGIEAQPGQGSVDTVRISLEDAILSGLQNNPTLLVQLDRPQQARTVVKELKGHYDPILTAELQQSQSQSQRRLGSSANPFEIKDTSSSFSASINQLLPSGTSIELSTGMSGSVSNLYSDQYAGNVGITITQSLLNGFSFPNNLANIRMAELDVEISSAELKAVAEAVTADVENAYWKLYLTAEEVEIQKRSLDLAQKQLVETEERVLVGKLPDLELAAVAAELASRRSQLIDASSQYEQARLRFIYLIYPDENQVWNRYPLPLDAPLIPLDTLDPVGVHESLGLKYRPDLIQARIGLQQQDLNVARTRNGLLPRLDLFISLGKTSYAATFSDAAPDISSPFYQANGGLSFSFPLRNRQASARMDRARVSRDQQEQAVDNMEKQVHLDIRSRYIEVNRTRQQVVATHVTRQLQEDKHQAELEKFRVGKSTNILVLQAQRDFTASQLDEARAIVAHLNALVDLYVSEGTLLERRGISTFD